MKRYATTASDQPKRFRAFAKGLASGKPEERVSETGGMFDRGYISGYSLCSVGPALGHEHWCDETFVAQIAEATQAAGDAGIKSRYTHGSMSGDGIEDSLGRTTWFESDTDQQARGILHFSDMANAEKRRQVLAGARDTPEDFGASIVFYIDYAAVLEHGLEHGVEIDEDGWPDWSEYQSPDERNEGNFPHVRLDRLSRSDIVGDPAANAGGMFGERDAIFRDAIALFEFAIGIREECQTEQFNLNRANVRPFAERFIVENFARLQEIHARNQPADEKRPADSEETVEDDYLAPQAAALAVLLL